MALGDVLATVMVVIKAETSELIAKLRGAPAEAKAAGEATGAAFSQGVTAGVTAAAGPMRAASKKIQDEMATGFRKPGEDLSAFYQRIGTAQGLPTATISAGIKQIGEAHKEAGKAAVAHGLSLEHLGRQALFFRREMFAVAGVVALLVARFREAQQFELGIRVAERTRNLAGAVSAMHAAVKQEEERAQLVQGLTGSGSIIGAGYSAGALLFKQSAGTITEQGIRARGAAEKLYTDFELPEKAATIESKLLQIRAQAAALDARKARTIPEFRAASEEEARLLAESNKQQQEAVRLKAEQAAQEMESLRVSSGPLRERLAALEKERAARLSPPPGIGEIGEGFAAGAGYDADATRALVQALDEEIAKVQALIAANDKKSVIAAGILALAEKEKTVLTAILGVEQERSRLAKQQEEIRRETAHQAFGVGMGRVTVQGEMGFLRAAMIDPRRTTEEQGAAEHALLDVRKRAAEDLVKHQQSLGVSTQSEQLALAKGFLAEATQGSQAWFDAVRKVSEVYVGIHEQAKQIAAEMISLAGAERVGAVQREQELAHQVDARIHLAALAQQMQRSAEAEAAARQKADAADEAIIARSGKPEHLTPREQQEREVEAARERIRQRAEDAEEQARQRAMTGGMALRRYWEEQQRFAAGKMSLADVPGFMDQARLRDEALLSGAVSGTPAELGVAMGRQDFWRTVDREGLSPWEAFSRAGEDPHKQLARQLASAVPAGAEPNRGIYVDWTGQTAWAGRPALAPPGGVTVDWTGAANWTAPAYNAMAAPGAGAGPAATGTAGALGALSQAMDKPGREMGEFSKAFTALMDRFEAGIAHMKADVEHVAQMLANMLNDQRLAVYGRR